MRRCEKASVIDDGRNARVEVRLRMTPVVLEPLLERHVVHRNLTGYVQHRLGVELVHLAWVERGEWAQIDPGRGARGLDLGKSGSMSRQNSSSSGSVVIACLLSGCSQTESDPRLNSASPTSRPHCDRSGWISGTPRLDL
jgi:hypothetical protein